MLVLFVTLAVSRRRKGTADVFTAGQNGKQRNSRVLSISMLKFNRLGSRARYCQGD